MWQWFPDAQRVVPPEIKDQGNDKCLEANNPVDGSAKGSSFMDNCQMYLVSYGYLVSANNGDHIYQFVLWHIKDRSLRRQQTWWFSYEVLLLWIKLKNVTGQMWRLVPVK
jgi:hypothetical protein